ncbi:MAG: EamA family transporter [Acidobacteria bacterium]|nr:EamA family transporter [Acidobacteriota bacterium]
MRAKTTSGTPGPPRLRLIAAFAAIYLIWGSTYLAIRVAIETIPPLLMAGCRLLSAGAILCAWARITGAARPSFRHWRAATVIGALLFLAGNGGVTWSEQHVPSGLVALIIATIPIWMALLDWLVHGGRRPGRAMILGLVLGLGGISLLVDLGGSRAAGGVDPFSVALLMLTSSCWAAGSLYSRSAPLPASPLLAVGMECLAGGALLILGGGALGEWGRFTLASVSLRSAISVAYLSLLGSVVTFTAYVWLLRVTTAARVSTYAYVNPVVALALGRVFAGEPVSPRTLAAGAIIVLAVVVITATGGGRSREPAVTPAPAEGGRGVEPGMAAPLDA